MRCDKGMLPALSLRGKLLLINLAVVAAALSTVVALMAWYEWKHTRDMLLDETRTQARVLADAASAALASGDKHGAREIVAALRLSPHIREGVLYTDKGTELVAYRPAGDLPPAAMWPVAQEGHQFGDSLLDVHIPVEIHGDVVGQILLRADLAVVQIRMRWVAIAAAAATLLALVFALFLSRRLHEMVAGPILRLAQITKEISVQADYSRRAVVEGRDEVATLAHDFNTMIEQIERRNKALVDELENRRRAEARLDQLAHFDALTALPNRRYFHNRLEAAISLSGHFNGMVSVMFIDLDNFKYVNDTLGHETGDELLRHVGRTLQATLRANDIICRLGGDEFAVIVEGVMDDTLLGHVAGKLIDGLAQPIQLRGQNVQVGCSIGVARYPADSANAEALLRAADAAMYHAKESGKNTFRFFHQQLRERTERRLRLEIALRETMLDGKGLEVYYQPVWSVKARRIVGVEALCRWQHPEQGSVSPADFIPIAEESDLILRLGFWVLEQACRQGAEWRRSGHSLQVAVNVSARQFHDPNFFDQVCTILDRTGLPPELLEIELTESVLMNGFVDLVKLFDKLRGLGVRIALDDFGTGYSSLSYLKRLPLDKLKIDRSFVRDLPHDADDRSIARAIVALSHSLNLHVQAEGVENAPQHDYLAELGCEFIQGYYISEALLTEDLTELLGQPRSGIAPVNGKDSLLSYPLAPLPPAPA